MKTVRFSNIIKTCGEPEVHLLLLDPQKDKAFQAADKGHRVMTVIQEAVGSKKDHGEIGYHPGQGRQFLVFPKSLRAYDGSTVVGIKYDLLESSETLGDHVTASAPLTAPPTKEKRPSKPKPEAVPQKKAQAEPPRQKSKPTRHRKAAPPRHLKPKKAERHNIVPFTPPREERPKDSSANLRKQIKKALHLLEAGKAVAAYNLLKTTLTD